MNQKIENVWEQDFLKVIMSNGSFQEYKKIVMRPIQIKNQSLYQFEMFTKTQAFHKNLNQEDARQWMQEIMESMNQIDVFCKDHITTIKRSKKGKIMEHTHKQVNPVKQVSGNDRKKKYLLEEGYQIPAFVDLGITTKEGTIIKAKYDKFKQINRFIEMVDDLLRQKNVTKLNIIDFGCGKSYLTFILYYYLVEVRKISVQMVGLDLKKDVIRTCNEIRDRYGYENLRFELGDIHGYHPDFAVDMVISLHACDVATDFALANAIQWKAKYILSVPCCQKEVNHSIQDASNPILSYGLLKERYSALVTDTIRAKVLEACGYQVQVLEFVDMIHSPKNILLRCQLMRDLQTVQLPIDLLEWIQQMHLQPTLIKELTNMGIIQDALK